MARLLVCLVLVMALATSCSGRSQHPFVPRSVTRDRGAEQTLAKLQARINARDARGICALYSSPSTRCIAIWQHRIPRFPTPVAFSMTRLIFGCAGDARLIFTETSARGERSRTLSLVSAEPGRYTRIIDVPTGRRRSTLIVPAYGTCATGGGHDGGIGADNLDPAQGNAH